MKLFRTLLRFISTGGTSLLTQPNVITQPSHVWYEKWATSPQAAKFTNTDWKRLHQLAPLIDEFHDPATTPDRKRQLSGEIRLSESKIGFTKSDYLRLKIATVQDGVLTYGGASYVSIDHLADAIHAALLKKQQRGSLGFN